MALTKAEQAELDQLNTLAGGLSPEEQAELDELNALAGEPTTPDSRAPEFVEAFGGQRQINPLAEDSVPGFLKASAQRFAFRDLPNLGQGIKENLPVIGATAASMAAPQIAIPARLSQAAPQLSAFLSQTIARAPAAGGGGFVGGGIREGAQPDASPESVLNAAVQSGNEMAEAELLGAGIGQSALKFFGPKMAPEARRALELSQEAGVPLSPSALAETGPSRALSRATEAATDVFLPSRLVNDQYRKKAVTQINRMMSDIPNQVGPTPGREQAAAITQDAFQSVLNFKSETAKRLSNEFIEDVGPSTPIPVTRTKALLNDILTNAKNKTLRNFATLELGKIGKGNSTTAEALEESLRQIGTELRSVKGRDAKVIGDLRKAIKSDFKDAGADMDKLNDANAFFAQNSALMKEGGRIAQMLKSGNLRPAALTPQIFRSGNEDFVQSLSKELPPEVWDTLRAQNIANLLESASKESTRIPGVRLFTSTDKLERIIGDNRKVFEAAYDDKTLQALDNFIDLAKRASKDASKFEQGISQLIQFGNLGALGTKALNGNLDPSIVIPSGGMMAIAMDIMRPNGVLKKWLTTGLDIPPGFAESVKLGFRAAKDGGNER